MPKAPFSRPSSSSLHAPRMLPFGPAATFLLAFLLPLLQPGSLALKCKCTQSSPKVPCTDGVCEVPTASSSCLMLDHPNSGLHYACSTNANLSEGECVEKVSRSGANVKVCSCFSSDFCNFKIWPGGQEVPEEEEAGGEEEEEADEASARREGARRHPNSAEWPRPRAGLSVALGMGLFVLTFLLSPLQHGLILPL